MCHGRYIIVFTFTLFDIVVFNINIDMYHIAIIIVCNGVACEVT